jgi:hypothetical protein
MSQMKPVKQSRSGRPERSDAQRRRDEALGRVGRVRRGVIGGAAALTAAFAALVSAAVPGRSLGARRVNAAAASADATSSSSASGSTTPPMPRLATPSQLGITPSSTAQQQAPTPAPTQATTPAPTPQPPAAAPQAAPAPAPSSGGGAVVSGGS